MHASHERRCAALTAAIAAEVFCDSHPTIMLMDLDQISATIRHIQKEAGYPATALHTVAIKANPVGKLLQVFRDLGMGAEAASLGELAQALHCGFPPEHIVFDSPAKTMSELRYALSAGVPINLDNFQELQRTADLISSTPELLPTGTSRQQLIGLRINPQVGEGSIAALSTGGAVSKFGFPLQEVRQQLLQAFRDYQWLNMLHLHVGSQGLQLESMINGIAAVWELLKDVEQQCGYNRIKVLDIGGGLSETLFQLHARLLKQRIPELFAPDCSVRLMTENGRSLLAKAGCAASRVEYTKSSGGRHIAVTHVGADLCMRACYLPETWALRVFLCDGTGRPKVAIEGANVTATGAAVGVGADSEAAAGSALTGLAGGGVCCTEGVVQDIAGPLCFQGDRLVVGRVMPKAAVGDYVVVADTGAYTLSMYS
eukprot:gene14311-38_t